MKEKRAFIILYEGEELAPDKIVEVAKIITTSTMAEDNSASIYTLSENDIVKIISANALHLQFNKSVTDNEEKCKTGNDAILCLNKIFNYKSYFTPGAFCIDLSVRLMRILDRENSGLTTDTDIMIKKAVSVLSHGCPYSTALAEEVGYTKEINKVIGDVGNRTLNINGAFKK